MIRRSNEYKVERIEGLKDGKGHVTVVNFFEPEDFLGKGRLYGKSIIEPGNSIGYHTHEGDQEAYYIIKGKALYNEEGVDTNAILLIKSAAFCFAFSICMEILVSTSDASCSL